MKDARITLHALSRAAGVPARTIRFYIARGLLPGPNQAGRTACYGRAHLARLREILDLKRRGARLAEMRSNSAEDANAPRPEIRVLYRAAEDAGVWISGEAAPWRKKIAMDFARRLRTTLEQGGKTGGYEHKPTGEDDE